MTLRVSLAQINTTVGDLSGNTRRVLEGMRRAADSGADLACFPELALTGYPPEDLLLKPQFIEDNLRAIERIRRATSKLPVLGIVGFVDRQDSKLYNAAAVLWKGRIVARYHKVHLPNYGVFDEKRYFHPGAGFPVIRLGPFKIGVNICEDIWHLDGPCRAQALLGGAHVVVNINASPYHAGKWHERFRIISNQARLHAVYAFYNNLIGGQDELVFDGGSMVVDARGRLLSKAHEFKEDFLTYDLSWEKAAALAALRKALPSQRPFLEQAAPFVQEVVASERLPARGRPKLPVRREEKLSNLAEIYRALVVGTRDYVIKNGFRDAVIGLSGGIDSSLVAAIACDALGSDRVHGVFMPTVYSSAESEEDAARLALNLGVGFMQIPIQPIFETYLSTLRGAFLERPPDITEENIQARIRGTILMALSNKFGWLVLTTGNKSEVSVGYMTLYGDTAGGFAVIKDVPKTLVYRLARFRNRSGGGRAVIPARVFAKAPSAELRPHQTDQDTLPPYDLLDAILKPYIEENQSLRDIARGGRSRDLVARVIGMVDRNEYKRRQAPPGVKITPRAFGKDRRMPITNAYRAG